MRAITLKALSTLGGGVALSAMVSLSGGAVPGTTGVAPAGTDLSSPPIALPCSGTDATHVYFDQTEETDCWVAGSSPIADQVSTAISASNQLVRPWDTNGQMCLFPDGSGRFTIGYNPTYNETNDQGGPNGGNTLTRKQPPVGEAIYNSDGSYSPSSTTDTGGLNTTNNLHVPGPYLLSPPSQATAPFPSSFTGSVEWLAGIVSGNIPSGVTGPGVTVTPGLSNSAGQSDVSSNTAGWANSESNTNNGLGEGGDVPPDGTADGNAFNNDGTFTGCAFGTDDNLFAVDLGNSQGSYPTLSSGRLIEWFADSNYQGVCVIYGPTAGGDNWPQTDSEGFTTHHVDGSGGLQQPGMLASDSQGNIYVPVDSTNPATDPVAGSGNEYIPNGQVLEFSNLPTSEAQCPDAQAATPTSWETANGDQKSYHVVQPTVFINAAADGMPFPGAIANDPSCPGQTDGCWAVDNIFFGTTAVEFFDRSGNPLASPAPIPANYASPNQDSVNSTNESSDPFVPAGTYNPFGMSFDKSGDMFLVDIGVAVYPVDSVKSASFGAGPANSAGRLLEFTFTNGVADPPTVIDSGENYPVSVTTCEPAANRTCPQPT